MLFALQELPLLCHHSLQVWKYHNQMHFGFFYLRTFRLDTVQNTSDLKKIVCSAQCCRSGSGSARFWSAGSVSKKGYNDPQKRWKWRNFMFWSVGCSLLRDEVITCSLYGLRINNCTFGLNFLYKFLSALKFTNFGHQNPDTDPHWSKNACFRSAMEPLRIHNTGFWVQFRSHFVRSGWF